MTKEELIATLRECAKMSDGESAHVHADAALIEYINDEEVLEAYEAVTGWCA